VLVVPLMEELFWRSFLMRWIEQRDFLFLAPASLSRFGVLASSLVFALPMTYGWPARSPGWFTLSSTGASATSGTRFLPMRRPTLPSVDG